MYSYAALWNPVAGWPSTPAGFQDLYRQENARILGRPVFSGHKSSTQLRALWHGGLKNMAPFGNAGHPSY